MKDYILKPGSFIAKSTVDPTIEVPGLSLEKYIVRVLNGETCCEKNIVADSLTVNGVSVVGGLKLKDDVLMTSTLTEVVDKDNTPSVLRISTTSVTNFGGGGITFCTAFGRDALIANTTGSNNSAIGCQALLSNTTGFSNSAMGAFTLFTNTTGTFNSAMGLQALFLNTTGSSNTAMGAFALQANTADSNSAFGRSALSKNTTGTFNSAFGRNALPNTTTGGNNSAYGVQALFSNVSGSFNAAIGVDTLKLNTTGNNNSAMGHNALLNNTASNNVAVGFEAALSNTSGTGITAIGYRALRLSTIGINNTAIGFQSLDANIDGDENTAVGANSLTNNTDGVFNTAIGSNAMLKNIDGSTNTAIGYFALSENLTGQSNTAVGVFALDLNLSQENTAVGYGALGSNSSGGQNTAIGAFSLQQLLSGSNNTTIGKSTGLGITTGSNNTILGANVTGLSATLANNIIIADGSGNRRINVDSSGNVGINENVPTARLQIKGSGSTSATTSLRVQNSSSTNLFEVRDDGVTFIRGTLDLFKGLTADGTLAQFYGYQVPFSAVESSIQIGQQFADTAIAQIGAGVNGGFLQTNNNKALRAIQFDSVGNVSIANGSSALSYSAFTIGGYGKQIQATELVATQGFQMNIAPKSFRYLGNPSGTEPQIVFNSVGRSSMRTILFTTTVTKAITFYIDGSPLAGNNVTITNGFALYVNQGRSYFSDDIGIGVEVNNTSAKVQIDSTTKGFLPPRMTTAQKNAIVTPAAGLMIYDSDLNKLCVYTTAWETITSI